MPDTLITADILLRAYAAGLFPMAESADDPELFWIEPQERGVIPLDRFHVSSRLARTVLSDCYEVRIDTDFNAVIAGCAASSPGREETWINQRIKDLYGELFQLGQCHTVEVWRDNKLVGGLYGLELGGAFFGESMFHKERDASKVALVHLVARLVKGEYTLLDTQFVTPHLASFGAIEITRDDYMQKLNAALKINGNWWMWEKKQQIRGYEVMEILRS